MRLTWDPHPTFTGFHAGKPDATPEYVEAAEQKIRDLYASYARSLDASHPMWHFEILTVRQPPHDLAVLAQERREKEGS